MRKEIPIQGLTEYNPDMDTGFDSVPMADYDYTQQETMVRRNPDGSTYTVPLPSPETVIREWPVATADERDFPHDRAFLANQTRRTTDTEQSQAGPNRKRDNLGKERPYQRVLDSSRPAVQRLAQNLIEKGTVEKPSGYGPNLAEQTAHATIITRYNRFRAYVLSRIQ